MGESGGITCGCGAAIASTAPGGLCPKCLSAELLGDLAAASDELPEGAPDEREFGGYRLIDLIGEGGFGTVHLAEQYRPLRRKVALKILKPGMDSRQVVARFRAEQQALALLDHPNITRVFDAGETPGGRPFFAMELVDGVPVTDYCREHAMDVPGRLRLFLAACDGIQHAHREGIIHRDIKPSNVLAVSDPRGGEPTIKVIDFGIAKATEHVLTDATLMTSHRQLMGTPEYMSPEQAASGGVDIDPRSDVFSLGVLLYELLAGVPPLSFGKKTTYEEVLRRIREDDPPRPSTRVTGAGVVATPVEIGAVRRDLDWIVMKAIEKEPARRYGAVAEMADDVRRYLAGEAIVARPPSVFYRARKKLRRHRIAAVVAGALLVALLGMISAAIYSKRVDRAEAEQRRRASSSDLQLANERLKSDSSGDAIAFLCRALRIDPGNSVAAEVLVNELVLRSNPGGGASPLVLDHAGNHLAFARFSYGGDTVGCFTDKLNFFMWDTANGSLTLLPFKFPGLPFDAGNADAPLVPYLSSVGEYRFFNWKTLRISPVAIPKEAPFAYGRMSPKGNFLVAGGTDGIVRQWRVADGERIRHWEMHEGKCEVIRITGEERFVVSVGADGTGVIADLRTGAKSGTFAHETAIQWMELSPDETIIATGSADNTARLWSIPDGRPLTPPLRHDGEGAPGTWVFGKFSKDGTRLVTAGSSDQCVRFWDVPGGEVADEPIPHDAAILSLAIDRERGRIITGSADGRGRIWDVATGTLLAPPLVHKAPVEIVDFNLANRQVLTVDSGGLGKIHEHVGTVARLPEWFLDVAEALGGKRFDERGVIVSTPKQSVDQLRALVGEGDVRTWAEWLLGDPATRGRSPFSAPGGN